MAEFLPQVLSLTGQLKRACKAPSHASHHNQQIAKLLGRLEVLLGDLEDAPAGDGWAGGVPDVQASLQQLLQLVKGSEHMGCALALITASRATQYKASTQAFACALQELLPGGHSLDDDVEISVQQLCRRVAALDFLPTTTQAEIAGEMRLEVQLHQLGRTSQDMLGRKLWQLLLAACTEADGLQGQTLQNGIRDVTAAAAEAEGAGYAAETAFLSQLAWAMRVHGAHADQAAASHLSDLPRACQGLVAKRASGDRLPLGSPQNSWESAQVQVRKVGGAFPSTSSARSLYEQGPAQAAGQKPAGSFLANTSRQSSYEPMRQSSTEAASAQLPAPQGSLERANSNDTAMLTSSTLPESSFGFNTTSSTATMGTPDNLTGSSSIAGLPPTPKRAAEPNPAKELALQQVAMLRAGSLQAAEAAHPRKGSSESAQLRELLRSSDGDAVAHAHHEALPDWIIPETELTIARRQDGSEHKLGQGAFGMVFKGFLSGVEPVAIKIVGGSAAENTDDGVQRAMRELSLLKDCRSPQIVQFLGACLWQGKVSIITELMPLGDLHTALQTRHVQWGLRALRIALDVARGLAFLHRRKIAHLDLKSPNVLLGRDYLAKIADVGIARVITNSHMSSMTSHGTFAWAAPELLLGDPVTTQADIYSYGVCLWELVTAEQPKRGQLRSLDVPAEASHQVDSLITTCMDKDPLIRPTAHDLVKQVEQLISEYTRGDHRRTSTSSNSSLPAISTLPEGQTGNQYDIAPASQTGSQLYLEQQGPNMGQFPEQGGPIDSPFGPGAALTSSSFTSHTSRRNPSSRAMSIGQGIADRFSIDSMRGRPRRSTSHASSPGTSMDGDEHRRAVIPLSSQPRLDKQLKELVEPDCTLRDLDLSLRGLGPDDFKAVAVALAHNASIFRVDLRRNKPELKGITMLSKALLRNTAVRVLVLTDCELGRDGARVLAEMLSRNASLNELVLFHTDVKTDGACTILEALASNSTLQKMDLGGNDLGPEVGRAAAQMLARNRGLETLDLRNNRLGKQGMLAVAEGLKLNTSLRQLKMGNNAANTLFGFGTAKAIFKEKELSTGLKTSFS